VNGYPCWNCGRESCTYLACGLTDEPPPYDPAFGHWVCKLCGGADEHTAECVYGGE
jgi:hypothetical protein